jgi:hypothetical protein
VLTKKARHDGLAWARYSGCLDITVSRGQLGRALRIADDVSVEVAVEATLLGTDLDGNAGLLERLDHVGS